MRTSTANKLRWLAEAADGMRDQDCVVVWVAEDTLGVVREQDVDGRERLMTLKVHTPSSGGGGMSGNAEVKLTYDGQPVPLPADTDAVFLSQAAVEKFVLPYYTRMESPEWIANKKAELFARNIVAAAHREPSITQPVPEGSGATLLPLVRGSDGKLEFDLNAIP